MEYGYFLHCKLNSVERNLLINLNELKQWISQLLPPTFYMSYTKIWFEKNRGWVWYYGISCSHFVHWLG